MFLPSSPPLENRRRASGEVIAREERLRQLECNGHIARGVSDRRAQGITSSGKRIPHRKDLEENLFG
jgi:hypothetical protein